jgi:hypothetical protein
VRQCARLRAEDKHLYVDLKKRIRRDGVMSGGGASADRFTPVVEHIRGIQ